MGAASDAEALDSSYKQGLFQQLKITSINIGLARRPIHVLPHPFVWALCHILPLYYYNNLHLSNSFGRGFKIAALRNVDMSNTLSQVHSHTLLVHHSAWACSSRCSSQNTNSNDWLCPCLGNPEFLAKPRTWACKTLQDSLHTVHVHLQQNPMQDVLGKICAKV